MASFKVYALSDWLQRNGAEGTDTLSIAEACHSAGIKYFGDFEELEVDDVKEFRNLGVHEQQTLLTVSNEIQVYKACFP